ncbi:uncharacterized protein DS421_20g697480 [Arachis hypogaea]|nr:uncharacterized protein DS421_20g697480 [Arachis hypogaea]
MQNRPGFCKLLNTTSFCHKTPLNFPSAHTTLLIFNLRTQKRGSPKPPSPRPSSSCPATVAVTSAPPPSALLQRRTTTSVQPLFHRAFVDVHPLFRLAPALVFRFVFLICARSPSRV